MSNDRPVARGAVPEHHDELYPMLNVSFSGAIILSEKVLDAGGHTDANARGLTACGTSVVVLNAYLGVALVTAPLMFAEGGLLMVALFPLCGALATVTAMQLTWAIDISSCTTYPALAHFVLGWRAGRLTEALISSIYLCFGLYFCIVTWDLLWKTFELPKDVSIAAIQVGSFSLCVVFELSPHALLRFAKIGNLLVVVTVVGVVIVSLQKMVDAAEPSSGGDDWSVEPRAVVC